MSQHDFSIANQTASSARSDINNGLQALASNNSGSNAPSTTYANMFWYDTTNNILKMRDETDSNWIDVVYMNQSTGVTSILDNTPVVTSGGATAGLIGDQASSAWLTGTSTIESLISPSKLKAFGDDLFDLNGKTSSNYIEIGGLYLQWRTANFTAQEDNIQYLSFPTSFPNACLNCQISMQINVGNDLDGSLYIRNLSTSQVGFQFSSTQAIDRGTGTVHILAIGH